MAAAETTSRVARHSKRGVREFLWFSGGQSSTGIREGREKALRLCSGTLVRVIADKGNPVVTGQHDLILQALSHLSSDSHIVMRVRATQVRESLLLLHEAKLVRDRTFVPTPLGWRDHESVDESLVDIVFMCLDVEGCLVLCANDADELALPRATVSVDDARMHDDVARHGAVVCAWEQMIAFGKQGTATKPLSRMVLFKPHAPPSAWRDVPSCTGAGAPGACAAAFDAVSVVAAATGTAAAGATAGIPVDKDETGSTDTVLTVPRSAAAPQGLRAAVACTLGPASAKGLTSDPDMPEGLLEVDLSDTSTAILWTSLGLSVMPRGPKKPRPTVVACLETRMLGPKVGGRLDFGRVLGLGVQAVSRTELSSTALSPYARSVVVAVSQRLSRCLRDVPIPPAMMGLPTGVRYPDKAAADNIIRQVHRFLGTERTDRLRSTLGKHEWKVLKGGSASPAAVAVKSGDDHYEYLPPGSLVEAYIMACLPGPDEVGLGSPVSEKKRGRRAETAGLSDNFTLALPLCLRGIWT